MYKAILLSGSLLLGSLFASAQHTLSGQVTDPSGKPLVGASVFLPSLQRGDATDREGRFEIDDVSAGTYLLRVTYLGYEEVGKEIEVGSSEPESLVIELTESGYQLDEAIVSATRADARTPMTYTNVGKEEIDERNLGQDVPFLLRYTPSAVVTSDAGTGIGYTGIRIRGTDPTRINVTINGIPVNDAESQGVFWVDLPDILSSTDDIQIQRGVGSSTNGAGAFGATINLSTNKLQREAYGELNGSVGSFNTWKANAQFGTGLIDGKFTLDGRLSTIHSDGFVDRASADLQSYYISGAWVGERSLLRLNTWSGHEVTYQAWYGIPKDSLSTNRTYNPAGMEKPGEPYDNQVDDYRQTYYQALFSHRFGEDWNLNLAAFYTRGKGFYEEYKADQTFGDYGLDQPVIGNDTLAVTDLVRRLWLDNHYYGGTYSVQWTPAPVFDLTIGGAYTIYEGGHYGEIIWAEIAQGLEPRERFYDNDATKRDFNIFAKAQWMLFPRAYGYLDLQYRRVDYQFLGIDANLDQVEQEVDFDFFNPKLGLLYDLGQNKEVYASFAVGQREPNRNDFVESTPANRPKPEKLYNVEAGFRGNWNRFALEANLYYMYYIDQLALNGQLNDVGAALRVNIDRSYRAGIELVGGWQIAEPLTISANATFSRNRVQAFTEYVDVYDAAFNWIGQDEIVREDTDLSFSPEIIAGAAIDWRIFKSEKHRLDLSLMSKYVGKQYIDNTGDENNALDPYFFSDLRLSYRLDPGFLKGLEFTFLVRNLFDAEFETNAWSYRYVYDGQTAVDQGFYPQAGINFLAGVKVRI